MTARALQGETIRVQGRDGEFVFQVASTPPRSLLGIAKGKMTIHGDLMQPTLPNDAWRPGLA
jgi:hypothetical protein